jgi:hypothetical protein
MVATTPESPTVRISAAVESVRDALSLLLDCAIVLDSMLLKKPLEQYWTWTASAA